MLRVVGRLQSSLASAARVSRLPSALFHGRNIHTKKPLSDCKYQVLDGVRSGFLKDLADKGMIGHPGDFVASTSLPARVGREIKAVAFDASGSSGDPLGTGTKIGMTNAVVATLGKHHVTPNSEMNDVISGAVLKHMGSAKLEHFERIFLAIAIEGDNYWLRQRYKTAGLREDAKAAYEHFRNEGLKYISDFSTPVPGMLETVNFLRRNKILVLLQSAYSETELEAFKSAMDRHGVKFDGSVSSSLVEKSRPAPEMLQLLCRRHHLHPHEVIAYGDTGPDMLAAVRGGCLAFGAVEYSALLPLNRLGNTTPAEDFNARSLVARELALYGAHYTSLDSNAETHTSMLDKFMSVIEHANARMHHGQFPHTMPEQDQRLTLRR